jgi:hypothetical protein
MGTRARLAAQTLAMAAATIVAIAPVDAGVPPLPVVLIESTSPVVISYACGQIDPSTEPGEVLVSRTGDVAAGLTITYEITGTVLEGPGTVDFALGEDLASIPVYRSNADHGPIELTLVDGDDYDLGDPVSTAVEVDGSGVETGCPIPVPPEPPVVQPTFTG